MFYGGGRYGTGVLYGAPTTQLVDAGAALLSAAALSAKPLRLRPGAMTGVGTGVVSARPERWRYGAGTFLGTGVAGAAGTALRAGSGAFAAETQISGHAVRTLALTAQVAGTGQVAARASATAAARAAMPGTGSVSAPGGLIRSFSAASTAEAVLPAAGQRLVSRAHTSIGTGALVGVGVRILSPPAALAGAASVQGRGAQLSAARGQMAGEGVVYAFGTRIRELASIDLGEAVLTALAERMRSGAGTLTAPALLTARPSRIWAGRAAVPGVALLVARRSVIGSGASSFSAAGVVSAKPGRMLSSRSEHTAEALLEGALTQYFLTAADARFFWDAGLGLTPLLGGETTFSRDSAAVAADRRDVLRQLIRDVARFEWVTSGGERRQAVLLEMARANKCPRNVDFATNGVAGWTLGGPGAAGATLTVVDDRAELVKAGLGELVSDAAVLRLDNRAGTAEAWALSSGSTGSTATHTASVYWRAAGTGTGRLGLSGIAAGTSVAVPTGGFQRAAATFTPVSGSALMVAAGAGADLYFVLPQLEDGASATSPIRNPGAGSAVRAVEQLGWDSPAPGGEVATYTRWIAGLPGAGGLTTPRVLECSSPTGTGPRMAVRHSATGIELLVDNGSAQSTGGVAVAIKEGDEVEVVCALKPDGSGRLIVSLNRGAPVGASVGPLAGGAPKWDRVWLNGSANTNVGRGRYLAAKMVAGMLMTSDVGRMIALRNFEISPNGETL